MNLFHSQFKMYFCFQFHETNSAITVTLLKQSTVSVHLKPGYDGLCLLIKDAQTLQAFKIIVGTKGNP